MYDLVNNKLMILWFIPSLVLLHNYASSVGRRICCTPYHIPNLQRRQFCNLKVLQAVAVLGPGFLQPCEIRQGVQVHFLQQLVIFVQFHMVEVYQSVGQANLKS